MEGTNWIIMSGWISHLSDFRLTSVILYKIQYIQANPKTRGPSLRIPIIFPNWNIFLSLLLSAMPFQHRSHSRAVDQMNWYTNKTTFLVKSRVHLGIIKKNDDKDVLSLSLSKFEYFSHYVTKWSSWMYASKGKLFLLSLDLFSSSFYSVKR